MTLQEANDLYAHILRQQFAWERRPVPGYSPEKFVWALDHPLPWIFGWWVLQSRRQGMSLREAFSWLRDVIRVRRAFLQQRAVLMRCSVPLHTEDVNDA